MNLKRLSKKKTYDIWPINMQYRFFLLLKNVFLNKLHVDSYPNLKSKSKKIVPGISNLPQKSQTNCSLNII